VGYEYGACDLTCIFVSCSSGRVSVFVDQSARIGRDLIFRAGNGMTFGSSSGCPHLLSPVRPDCRGGAARIRSARLGVGAARR
jgi:hypothetical protein